MIKRFYLERERILKCRDNRVKISIFFNFNDYSDRIRKIELSQKIRKERSIIIIYSKTKITGRVLRNLNTLRNFRVRKIIKDRRYKDSEDSLDSII